MLSRIALTCTLIALTVGFVAAESPNSPESSEPQSLDQLIAAVRWANIDTRRDAYQKLFAAADKDQLAELERHSDTSIAIQSAWETARDSLTFKERENRVRCHNRMALSRFIGFLEGRTLTSVPKWWRDFVMNDAEPHPTPLYGSAQLDGVTAPTGTTIEFVEQSYRLKIGDKTIYVPDNLLGIPEPEPIYGLDGEPVDDDAPGERLPLSIDCISAILTETHGFIATHDDQGGPHDVGCAIRSCSYPMPVWTAKACGCWQRATTGVHQSWVTIVADENEVIVYGASTTGFYVHGFEAVSGKTLYQFSTWYQSDT